MDNSAGKTDKSKNAVKNWSQILLTAILCFAVSGMLSCESIDKTALKGPTAAESEKDLPGTTSHGKKIEEIYLDGGSTGILMIHGYSSTCLSLEPLAKVLNQNKKSGIFRRCKPQHLLRQQNAAGCQGNLRLHQSCREIEPGTLRR